MTDMSAMGRRLLAEASKKDPPQNAMVKRQGQVLPTENKAWGFYGTMKGGLLQFGDAESVEAVWKEAFRAFLEAYPGVAPQVVREFLDSKDGRHFADSVVDTFPAPTDPNFEVMSGDPRPGFPRTIRAVLRDSRNARWITKELNRLAAVAAGSAATAAIPAGGLGELGALAGRVQAALKVAEAEEAKKNWPQRAAAVKGLMAASDALLTACRAWFANNR